jgi:hypothetical protein
MRIKLSELKKIIREEVTSSQKATPDDLRRIARDTLSKYQTLLKSLRERQYVRLDLYGAYGPVGRDRNEIFGSYVSLKLNGKVYSAMLGEFGSGLFYIDSKNPILDDLKSDFEVGLEELIDLAQDATVKQWENSYRITTGEIPDKVSSEEDLSSYYDVLDDFR